MFILDKLISYLQNWLFHTFDSVVNGQACLTFKDCTLYVVPIDIASIDCFDSLHKIDIAETFLLTSFMLVSIEFEGKRKNKLQIKIYSLQSHKK